MPAGRLDNSLPHQIELSKPGHSREVARFQRTDADPIKIEPRDTGQVGFRHLKASESVVQVFQNLFIDLFGPNAHLCLSVADDP